MLARLLQIALMVPSAGGGRRIEVGEIIVRGVDVDEAVFDARVAAGTAEPVERGEFWGALDDGLRAAGFSDPEQPSPGESPLPDASEAGAGGDGPPAPAEPASTASAEEEAALAALAKPLPVADPATKPRKAARRRA
jgi:hypothetical protein